MDTRSAAAKSFVQVQVTPTTLGGGQGSTAKSLGEVDAPRTLPIPERAPSHPSAVLDQLVAGGFVSAEDRETLVAAVESYGGSYDLKGTLTNPDVHLCTGTLGELASALANVDVSTLSPGARTGRGSLLFWVRSETVGGGTLGAHNARGFSDY